MKICVKLVKNPFISSYLVGVPLVEAELTISVGVVRVVAAALVLLVLHEVEVPATNISSHINVCWSERDNCAPVQAVEGVSEEQGHKAVCPGVGAEHVEDAQFWTTEPDPSQELELEVGFAVELALYVVLQD